MTNFIFVYIILKQINKTTVQVMVLCFLVVIDFSIILELCSIGKDSNSHSQSDEFMTEPGPSKAVKEYISAGIILFCCDDRDKFNFCIGRAIAQTVSRWLPTAAARVRAWFDSGHVGFAVKKWR
jgi:hypothetical protein